jgi:general secretion pathway protein G
MVNTIMPTKPDHRTRIAAGFSMIELMVVLAIIALLLTIVAPRYQGSIATSKEIVLKENLSTIRKALDQYYADKGKFPTKLDDLVTAQYLRILPIDPITNKNDSWILIGANAQPMQVREPTTSEAAKTTLTQTNAAIHDVRSGALGESKDGGAFNTW